MDREFPLRRYCRAACLLRDSTPVESPPAHAQAPDPFIVFSPAPGCRLGWSAGFSFFSPRHPTGAFPLSPHCHASAHGLRPRLSHLCSSSPVAPRPLSEPCQLSPSYFLLVLLRILLMPFCLHCSSSVSSGYCFSSFSCFCGLLLLYFFVLVLLNVLAVVPLLLFLQDLFVILQILSVSAPFALLPLSRTSGSFPRVACSCPSPGSPCCSVSPSAPFAPVALCPRRACLLISMALITAFLPWAPSVWPHDLLSGPCFP
jgi:hypothetical protein